MFREEGGGVRDLVVCVTCIRLRQTNVTFTGSVCTIGTRPPRGCSWRRLTGRLTFQMALFMCYVSFIENYIYFCPRGIYVICNSNLLYRG